MIVDRTEVTQLQRSVWGHQQSRIATDIVDVIDDAIYNPIYNIHHQIENAIEAELRQSTEVL